MTLREKTTNILGTDIVQRFIIGVILFNAVILGLESSDTIMHAAGGLIYALDTLYLAIFVVEILAKLFAYQFRFFRSGWNVFDFLIVGIALVPATEAFSVLRALRILRVLRVISATPRRRRAFDRITRHGKCVRIDVADLLYRLCYFDKAVW